jgi:4-amino-4-deoxy-L-arabinose transferase-like glycosyltransferase
MSDLRWTSLLFAAALLARLASSLGSAIFGTDSCHYLLMADWMRDGRFHEALSVAYHPMYPLLTAVARGVTATTEQAACAVSMLLGSAAVVPLFHVTRFAFGRPTAVLASMMYAFQPAIVNLQGEAMTEGTFMFFLFASMWLTRRMMDEPSLERGAVLGAAAAAAFLTRVEGLLAIALAVGWPAVELLRRRPPALERIAGLMMTLLVVGVMLSPYLFWVKSVRGRWGLSVRPSAISAEKSVGIVGEVPEAVMPQGRAGLYWNFGVSLYRLSLWGILVPFLALGAAALGSVRWGKALFFLSFPLGHMGGLLFALRKHTFMTDRYLMPATVLLSAVAALGMVVALRAAARRWPDSPRRPVLCAAAVFLIVVAPVIKSLQYRRLGLRSCPGAAGWILAHGPRPRGVTGLEQVAYFCGARSYYFPAAPEELESFIARNQVDYVVYSERDIDGRPEFMAMIRNWSRLEPAVEYVGPPGTWKVYIQRVK